MKTFVCSVCGYIHTGDSAPETCPLCKVGADKFNELVNEELNFVTEHKIGDD
jgi:rubrerythrin